MEALTTAPQNLGESYLSDEFWETIREIVQKPRIAAKAGRDPKHERRHFAGVL